MVEPPLLIIENDETICLSLKVFFEGRGYEVATSLARQEGRGREVDDRALKFTKRPAL